MTKEELQHILDQHKLWLAGKGGARADLCGANLYTADLTGADLRRAKLRGANLCTADLTGADLRHANLCGADLCGAKLRGANLTGADLRDAALCSADLRDADLCNANLPHFEVCPEQGAFIGWKKLAGGAIAKLTIPKEAKRTSSLVGRKCRCEFAFVEEIFRIEPECEGKTVSKHDARTVYEVGSFVYPDSYNDDIRLECTNGIHFFITRKEAEEY